MSAAEDTVEVEEEPTRAVAVKAPEMWEASPLAVMDEETFEQRVTLAKRERERLATVQLAVMKESVDYGTIPGTDKPTLLKPGGETLNKMAGLVATYDVTRTPGDGQSTPTILYLIRCSLHKYDEGGPVVAEGVGSCNSWERKYRWRSGAICSSCGQALRKSKQKEEWYCWRKTGGCGDTFPLEDFQAQQIENEDPLDLDNTLLKMARKRAYIDATLTAHAASGLFTQDVEDQQQSAKSPQADEPAKKKTTGRKAAPWEMADHPLGQRTLKKASPALVRENYENWVGRAKRLKITDEQRDQVWRDACRERGITKDGTDLDTLITLKTFLNSWLPEEADEPSGEWESGEDPFNPEAKAPEAEVPA